MGKRDQLSINVIEHRRREDQAPRLCREFTSLRSLRLTFEELHEGRPLGRRYAKPVVVATAPAYFEIPCMEPRCDGHHDLTAAVLRELRRSTTSFTGQSECAGRLGEVSCDRILRFVCEATYAGDEELAEGEPMPTNRREPRL